MASRPILTIIVASLVLLGLSRLPAVQSVLGLAHFASQPVLAAETKAARKSVSFFSVLASLRDLAAENAQLKAKNTELEAELGKLKEVAHQNAILRQELNFTKESDDTYLPAQLIGRTPSGGLKEVLINRGSHDGVTVGQAVVAQGYLIGTVSQVQDRQAMVRLLSHSRSVVPALLQGSRATGLLRGGISGLTLTDLLIDAEVKASEPVVTSGLGGGLPSGIPIGNVVALTAKKGDITKTATVSSPVEVTKLEMVFVRKVK